MSSLSHAVRLALAAAVLGIAAAGTARSAPQEPPGDSAASMKAYTQTIPGSESEVRDGADSRRHLRDGRTLR